MILILLGATYSMLLGKSIRVVHGPEVSVLSITTSTASVQISVWPVHDVDRDSP